jgi:hypothetical protein
MRSTVVRQPIDGTKTRRRGLVTCLVSLDARTLQCGRRHGEKSLAMPDVSSRTRALLSEYLFSLHKVRMDTVHKISTMIYYYVKVNDSDRQIDKGKSLRSCTNPRAVEV